MITLQGSSRSRANRCVWRLKELGVAFESVPTNFQAGGTREPAFLDMNPKSRVPDLDDDGFICSNRWLSTSIWPVNSAAHSAR